MIRTIRGSSMTCFVGLDVSQKMTAICVVDNAGRRRWRGQCPTVPEQISVLVCRHAGDDARMGIETGAMTHELRNLGLEVVCLDARHARAALETDPRLDRFAITSSSPSQSLEIRVCLGGLRSYRVGGSIGGSPSRLRRAFTPVNRPGKSERATSASSARSVPSSSMAAAIESPPKSCSCASCARIA